MARAPVSKTGGCRFESATPANKRLNILGFNFPAQGANQPLLPNCYHSYSDRAGIVPCPGGLQGFSFAENFPVTEFLEG